MRYAIVIEQAGESFSAFVPDLPGCVATAASRSAAEQAISEAIALHIAGMKQDGDAPPEPSSTVEYVEIPA